MLRKKQVEEFQLLVLELNSFLENPDKLEYSDSISPELAGLIGAIGAGAIGVGSVLYSSKIKIIRCQLALMNSSSIVGFVS
ncbi:hypothetical protein [Streptococcus sp. FT1-106]|uniref:hypothetical protein n=1 Tax=unclassified Streptococcus TaxID=2608887 RepID=UPI003BF5D041